MHAATRWKLREILRTSALSILNIYHPQRGVPNTRPPEIPAAPSIAGHIPIRDMHTPDHRRQRRADSPEQPLPQPKNIPSPTPASLRPNRVPPQNRVAFSPSGARSAPFGRIPTHYLTDLPDQNAGALFRHRGHHREREKHLRERGVGDNERYSAPTDNRHRKIKDLVL